MLTHDSRSLPLAFATSIAPFEQAIIWTMFRSYVQWDGPLVDNDYALPLAITVAALVLIPSALLAWFTFDFYPPPTYEVPVPEQCLSGWLRKAEVLETPSLQVRSVMCQP